MKKCLFNVVLALVCAAVLIAVGFNAVSKQVTVEEKQSSFKLTDFDFVVRSPANTQISEFDALDDVVKAVFPCYGMDVVCKSNSTDPEIRILFSDDMVDYGISLFSERTLVSGTFDKSGLMLDETAAERLKVSVGDTVTLKLRGRNVQYRVSAIYRASTYDTLDEGIGLVEYTEEIANLYKDVPKTLSYTLAFIDAENEDALADALTSYKPLGNLKVFEDFIKDYTRRPGLSDSEWLQFLEAEYEKYYSDAAKELKAAGNVERKSDYMADVVDRIETTQHKVDALTIGIAIASAVVFTLASVVILYLGKGNDLILAREGAEKAHLAKEKLAINCASTLFVSLVSLFVLFGYAYSKGFVNETIGAVLLCSLPVLVNIPVSFVAVKLYTDAIYGKAEMTKEEGGLLRIEDSNAPEVKDSVSSADRSESNADKDGSDSAAKLEDNSPEGDKSNFADSSDKPVDTNEDGGKPEPDGGASALADSTPKTEGSNAAAKEQKKDAQDSDDGAPKIKVTEGNLGSEENPAE